MLAALPDQITLIAMGDNGIDRTDEDEVCAIHLRNRLEGRGSDREAVSRLIMAGGEVSRFHDPARPYLYREDVEIGYRGRHQGAALVAGRRSDRHQIRRLCWGYQAHESTDSRSDCSGD